jgi:hypothetical protein
MASSRRPAGSGPGPEARIAQARIAQAPIAQARIAQDEVPQAGRQLARRPETARSRSARSRPAGYLSAYLTGVAVLAGLAVAGCGSVTAGTTGAGSAASASRSGSGGASTAGQDATGPKLPARSALCAHPGRARRVLIARTGTARILEGGRKAQPAGSLPPTVGSRPVTIRTVTSPSEVHGLARALCALPRMPRGPLPCPALFPGGYQFYFTADGLRLPVVVVQESGCREVTGLGPVRRADQPAFWRLLGHIIGALPLAPVPSPGSVQPGGPDLPGSGLVTGCEPTRGPLLRACPFQPGVVHKPWA